MNPLLALALRVPLHGLGVFVALLPRRVEVLLGRLLGRVFLLLDPKRRKVAAENMRLCLPELGDAGLARLLRRNYEHYGILLLEMGHMFTPWPGHYRAYVARTTVVQGFENWKRAHDKGKGVFVVGGHFANWETCASAGCMAGLDLTIVTRHLKPEWLHRWIEGARLSTGLRCVYQPRTMPAIMKGLRDGRSIGFVLDQYMPPPMGSPMQFFGVTVDTLAAVAPLARRTGGAIVFVRQHRDSAGGLRAVLYPEFELSGDDAADNQRLARVIEDWIREEPEQWLWVHRRFKNVDWNSYMGRKAQTA